MEVEEEVDARTLDLNPVGGNSENLDELCSGLEKLILEPTEHLEGCLIRTIEPHSGDVVHLLDNGPFSSSAWPLFTVHCLAS